MAGYSGTALGRKLGIGEGHAVLVDGGPEDFTIDGLPEGARVDRVPAPGRTT